MANRLPYGTFELDPVPRIRHVPVKRVRCFVRGCQTWLQPPTKKIRGEVCEEHGIRCHHSSSGATYAYVEPQRNIIVSPQTFGREILRHPLKLETHRFGQERSEDALTWNVFRSLQEADQLSCLVHWLVGEKTDAEPFLYLWGICLTDDDFSPWERLLAARRQFERNLPVLRPLTEPDIAIYLPGKYVILMEAKFTSRNPHYQRGPRANASSLTLQELVDIYQHPRLRILDTAAAANVNRIPYQLWRNMVFAEWIAQSDHPNTKAYHFNLTRAAENQESANAFQRLLRPEFKNRFRRITWEQVHQVCGGLSPLVQLGRYLQTKTAGLRPAFQLP